MKTLKVITLTLLLLLTFSAIAEDVTVLLQNGSGDYNGCVGSWLDDYEPTKTHASSQDLKMEWEECSG